MDQYRPEHRAFEVSSLRRRITPNEYKQAVEYAQKIGLKRLAKS